MKWDPLVFCLIQTSLCCNFFICSTNGESANHYKEEFLKGQYYLKNVCECLSGESTSHMIWIVLRALSVFSVCECQRSDMLRQSERRQHGGVGARLFCHRDNLTSLGDGENGRLRVGPFKSAPAAAADITQPLWRLWNKLERHQRAKLLNNPVMQFS